MLAVTDWHRHSMLILKLIARGFLHQPWGVLPDDAPGGAFLSLPKRCFKWACSVPRQHPDSNKPLGDHYVGNDGRKVAKPLIEHLLQEVKAEIRMRTKLQGDVANLVDPLMSQLRGVAVAGQRRRNTSRDAAFNLARSAGNRTFLSA